MRDLMDHGRPHTLRRTASVAAMALLAVLVGFWAAPIPATPAQTLVQGLGAPGGIAALPSAAPAVPGLANQGIPAIIATGQPAIVAVFCAAPPGPQVLPFVAGPCPDTDGSGGGAFGAIRLELTRVFPGSGTPTATFAATGSNTFVVTDNGGGDMDLAVGVVAVEVDAGWGNEILRVTATDETGDARFATIVVVDTMLAWGPAGAVATVGQEGFAFVSYRCGYVGRSPLSNPSAQFAESELADADNSQGLDDMYDGLYGQFNGPGAGWGSNTLAGDADFLDVWCGGVSSGLFDDFVDFQTDKGILSIDAVAVMIQQNSANLAIALGYFYPPSLDPDCGDGQHVDTFDIDALSAWGTFLFGWPPGGSMEGGCDVDGWRNGVVTTQILPAGDVGVATVTAQQGGGGPLRSISLAFAGEAALSLFIEPPEELLPAGADFTTTAVDQEGWPVGGEEVACSISPAGPFVVVPGSGTTGPNGIAAFSILPTGLPVSPGQEFVIACWLDRDPNVSATATVPCAGLCGDADVDWDVDAVDALFVLQYVVGSRLGDDVCTPGSGVVCLLNTDVDCDGDTDAVDALFILQYVGGLRVELCACPL